ncbi:MAG: cardiolipin synthase B [Gammaproteobacteria bacterium]|nr:MAG: cardiolipin synthase B [Gammaproteobacteria bacterium]
MPDHVRNHSAGTESDPAVEARGRHCDPPADSAREPCILYTEGDELYAAMLAAIRAARRHVCLESYIFSVDEVGRRFVEALQERAANGVRVHLMVDAVGSLLGFSRAVERELRKAGVQVRRFHRWSWRRPWLVNRRDHRKLLVVDGRQAWLGGYNIQRECSREVVGEARWRDTHVGVGGCLARRAQLLFDAFWYQRGDRVPTPECPADHSVLLSNQTRRGRLHLNRVLHRMMAGSRHTLDLTTPYFVPTHSIRMALQAAARRGVRVRLLVPRRSDVALAQWAGRAVYDEMINNGIRVYEYLPRFIHAKTMVADGERSLVGTANLDYRSLLLNYELVLQSRQRELAAGLEARFERDLTEAREVRAEHWRRRPRTARLAEALAWSLRRWL